MQGLILMALAILAAGPAAVFWMVLTTSPAVSATAQSSEAAFLNENQTAMSKMMAGMTAKPSGDVDQDFAAMMIPHHQGAIDMALSELRYGRNEQLRRIAQEIIVEQNQEIAAMRLAVNRQVPRSSATLDQPGGR